MYHSFFLLTVLPNYSAEVLWRVPERRARVDDVEAGLGIFINDIITLGTNKKDQFGSFVITTSDGSRFFAYWRGSNEHVFVGVC
jgi:hypothetical protein